jgi:hypothetical protein
MAKRFGLYLFAVLAAAAAGAQEAPRRYPVYNPEEDNRYAAPGGAYPRRPANPHLYPSYDPDQDNAYAPPPQARYPLYDPDQDSGRGGYVRSYRPPPPARLSPQDRYPVYDPDQDNAGAAPPVRQGRPYPRYDAAQDNPYPGGYLIIRIPRRPPGEEFPPEPDPEGEDYYGRGDGVFD